jgi:hypothetical protein
VHVLPAMLQAPPSSFTLINFTTNYLVEVIYVFNYFFLSKLYDAVILYHRYHQMALNDRQVRSGDRLALWLRTHKLHKVLAHLNTNTWM